MSRGKYRQDVLPLLGFFGSQVFEEAGEGGLEGIVILPARKIGDKVFAEFNCQILTGVGIEACPTSQRVEVHQPDGKQFAAIFLLFHFSRLANFRYHPLALDAVFGKY